MTLLTGFLGSGKTTLLRRALSAPGFADTAVVVNEIGEIAIDHYLVDFVEGQVVELPGGCLCCAVREDLAQTLRGLIARRDAGEIRRFRRLVIETSGLADPAPILFTLGTDPMLDQRLRLGRVVTLVDAVAGLATLDRVAAGTRQAAIADALVFSKTDLAPFGADLAERLAALNPAAERLLGAATRRPGGRAVRPPRPSPPPHPREGGTRRIPPQAGRPTRGRRSHAAHSHGVAAYTIVLEGAVSRLDFARALGGLAMSRGNDLLRVKGIVRFADRPGPGRRPGGAARDVRAAMARRVARRRSAQPAGLCRPRHRAPTRSSIASPSPRPRCMDRRRLACKRAGRPRSAIPAFPE